MFRVFMLFGIVTSVLLACGRVPPDTAANGKGARTGVDKNSTEFQRVLGVAMELPEIRTEPGFKARLLVPPGQLYDPLYMHTHGNTVWVNDDGGWVNEDGQDKGGRIMAIDDKGQVSTVVGLGRLWGPPLGFDIAPASFAPYQGQLFTISQAQAGETGAFKRAHIVQRVDPTKQQPAETVCTLPLAGGVDGKGLPTGGMEGRFGPDGTPFAGKFFGVTVVNGTVYQVTPDGQCAPFVTFDRPTWGFPVSLQFTKDGQHLLVSMYQFKGKTPGKATIARVRPDGTIEPDQLVRTSPDQLISLGAMEYAPDGFGEFGGQLFIATSNEKYGVQYPTNPVPEGSQVYRLTPEGELKLVATGFHIAFGLHFFGNRLWVSDINGDFTTYAHREIPDGFVVEITSTR